MKKNSLDLADDEIDLKVFISTLWREKILILSISIIFGFFGYLYVVFQPQEFKTEITLKNPPPQIFQVFEYSHSLAANGRINNMNKVHSEFIENFRINFLSLDNLQSFVDESGVELDDFKRYLKSRNITAKQYFDNRIGPVNEKNKIIPNKYFLVFTNNLDGDIFFNNYVYFVKKKSIYELKYNIKATIEERINTLEKAYDSAKIINLENPIMFSSTDDPGILYKHGHKILLQNINDLKKTIIKLENNEFNFNIILDKASTPKKISISKINTMFFCFLFGLLFSIVLIILGLRTQNKS